MPKTLTWSQEQSEFQLEEREPGELPLDDRQLAEWLALPLDHHEGPAAVTRHLAWSTREAIRRRAALTPASHLMTLWARAAVRFAPFTQRSGEWALNQLKVVHRVDVSTWAIDEFLVTDADQRFFTLPSQVLVTSAEFQFIYDQTPLEHLEHHMEMERDRFDSVADLQVVTRSGAVETRRIHCLLASSPGDWELEEGEHLLDSSLVGSIVPEPH
jgi:hypothetical protein